MSALLDVLSAAQRQAAALEELEHRPWPLPDRPWTLGQTWENLLFAHWRVDHDGLRPHVPAALELEEFDGSAWIGLVPFHIAGIRLRGTLPAPLLSSFHELNCRTCVRRDGRPGIWFFSLDASSRWAVEAARRLYKLPYHHARITASDDSFECSRIGDDGVAFSARYRGEGPVLHARPGTLEHFLTERYCLYAAGGYKRADIHHPPWPLQRAEGVVELQTLAPVPLEGEPMLHYADRINVLIWSLQDAVDG